MPNLIINGYPVASGMPVVKKTGENIGEHFIVTDISRTNVVCKNTSTLIEELFTKEDFNEDNFVLPTKDGIVAMMKKEEIDLGKEIENLKKEIKEKEETLKSKGNIRVAAERYYHNHVK